MGRCIEVINGNACFDDVRAIICVSLGSGGVVDYDDELHVVDPLAFDVYIIAF